MADDARIATLESHIASAEAMLGELALKLEEHPNDKRVKDDIAALHAEIAESRQKIDERRLAVKARERLNTTTAKATRRDARKSCKQGVEAVASHSLERLVALHTAMIDATRAFNTEFDAVRQERREAFHGLLRSCGPHRGDGPIAGHRDAMLDSGEISTSLVRSLVIDAGLGREGPDLTPWIVVETPSTIGTKQWTFAAAIERANARMLEGAAQAVGRVERIENAKEQ